MGWVWKERQSGRGSYRDEAGKQRRGNRDAKVLADVVEPIFAGARKPQDAAC